MNATAFVPSTTGIPTITHKSSSHEGRGGEEGGLLLAPKAQ